MRFYRKVFAGCHAGLLFVCAAALGGEGRIEISQAFMPYAITNSGSYVVTEPLTGTSGRDGISIMVSDVSLDLNGFPLMGVPGALDGVASAPGLVNISVRNGSASGWGGDGFALAGTTNVALHSLRASRNGRSGISAGSAATVTECNTLANGLDGIACRMGGIISRCTAKLNGGHGIVAGQGSTIGLCAVRDSVSNGYSVADACVLSDCTARDNSDHGFASGTGATVTDCNAYSNSDDGYRLLGGGSKLSGSVSYGNGDFGVVIDYGSLVTRCTVRANSDGGIALSSNCFVIANIFDNSTAGVGVEASGNDSRIEGNAISRNATGLQVTGANNLLIRNSMTENGTNLSVSSGNHITTSQDPGGNMPDAAWINFSL